MKVKFIPYQPHCFAFGGFEIQMLSTLNAAIKSGVQAEKIDVWSRDNDFEILHCWGLGLAHYDNVQWAVNAGKKVVITALLPYNEFLFEKFRHLISSYIRKAYFLTEIAEKSDAIVVVNDLQAEVCRKYFMVPPKKIHIIPNIVHDNYFKVSNHDNDTIFPVKYGFSNYVLISGNVCKRKNQLNLIKACIKERIKLVIIGSPLQGENDYINQVEELIKSNPDILWIKGLPENSPDLISAYKHCVLVALPSYNEQQPICLLEAVAMGKPLLIANRAYAKQIYYLNSCLVNPDSIDDIANGIKKIISNPANYQTPRNLIEECSESHVGDKYHNLYKKII